MKIRQATQSDGPAIWAMLAPVFRAGDTYAIDADISEEDALSYWLGASAGAYLCEEDGVALGTYYITRNQKGGGSHVCNCGYITAPQAQGRGVARAMLVDSLERAPKLGFRAMQYNFVVATNTRAIATWERAGFDIVGRLPKAFQHPRDGFVDALVMYKSFAD